MRKPINLFARWELPSNWRANRKNRIWENGGEEITSFDLFCCSFQAVFNHSTVDFAQELHTVATAGGWNEPALSTTFWRGLRPELQVKLAWCNENVGFDTLVSMAIQLEDLLRERHLLQKGRPLTPSLPNPPPGKRLFLVTHTKTLSFRLLCVLVIP